MRVLLACLLVHVTSGVALKSIYQDEDKLLSEFEHFKRDYGKVYRSNEEEIARFSIYLSNRRYIDQHNEEYRLGKHTFTLKMNQFGDIPHEEFSITMTGHRRSVRSRVERTSYAMSDKPTNLSESIDWRRKGAVTPVKSQGSCAAGWAFSATGCLEGAHFIGTSKLVSLSEQNLIDCSGNFGNIGCIGGRADNAFNYIIANGIDTESSYPYEGAAKSCRYSRRHVGATAVAYFDLMPSNEGVLTWAIENHGPIAVGVDSSPRSFQFYHSGVYSDKQCSPTHVDQGVLAVGFGTDTDKHGRKQDYYIVKNSFNVTWGEQGYIRIARNKNNTCGIASMPSFVLTWL